MSLLPLVLREALEHPFRRPMFDQNFGLGLLDDDLSDCFVPLVPYRCGYIRPWRREPARNTGISNVKDTKDAFKVSLDVQQFKPEEITVKTVDNYVVVEGKHEERQDDHGFVSRHFQRRYLLPESVDPQTVISKLSSDGILSIEAPKKMSLLPLLLREALDNPRPSLFDQHFGLGLLDDDLISQVFPTVPYCSGYIRPWRREHTQHSGVSNIQHSKDTFKVNLDVQQFQPEEIAVKVVDNYVVVEGKHEERQDEHGFISRQFQRRYPLPETVDPDTVVSKLSSDGILTIEAPKKVLSNGGNERVVTITHTNEPATPRSKKSSKDENSEAKE